MKWGKVFYVFFALMSLTTSVGYMYEQTAFAIFLAASINVVSTLLKIGIRNVLSAELLAGSLVADLHLLPAFFAFEFYGNIKLATGLVAGAIVANLYTIIVSVVESSKEKEGF